MNNRKIVNEYAGQVSDPSTEAEQPTHDVHQSSKMGASWAEGATEPGTTKPSMYSPTPDHHFQAQALLPVARRIALGLGQQEKKLRDEMTPILKKLRKLAEGIPSSTVARQQTEFIIATIQHMIGDAKEAEQRARQVVADLENEIAKGSDPPDWLGSGERTSRR